MLLAVAYLKLVPKSYTGSLAIAALPAAQADVYTELNATDFVAIDEQRLLSLFIEDLESYDSIERFIDETQYITQNPEETDSEFALRLRQTAYGFTFTAPTPEQTKNSQASWLINITTHDKGLASKLLQQALLESNDNVNSGLEKAVSRRVTEHLRSLKHELQDIENERINVIAQYHAKVAARIAYLGEQAQIARSLNIDNGTLSSQSYTAAASVVTAVTAAKAFYLRGYLAIEKEMQLLESRVSEEPFIPMIAALDNRKRLLQQDAVIDRVQEMMSITPIGTDDFAAATYDMASVSYKSKTKSTLVLALSVVLGGMLGIFVLLIRNAVIRKD